ncbi:hypothetical protein SYJ56_20465 [Algoriphagus sp. D3-2-R+10]|nr:hypothetical protein [Algoriphagus sp. D3-2-R+10]MEB2777701.1 hypothetical protein [Algoriphagus sp. D3-2-R+10]
MSYCRLTISAFQLVASREVHTVETGDHQLFSGFKRITVIDKTFLKATE